MNSTGIKVTASTADIDLAIGPSGLFVEVQYVAEEHDGEEPPSAGFLQNIARLAYEFVQTSQITSRPSKDLTIRIVDSAEMRDLNKLYRGKDKPTNVLSFEFDEEPGQPPETQISLLGDIVLCHSVVNDEAREQDKPLADHYAHMVVHGVLHLMGFDHEDEEQAAKMESLETAILAKSDIANPYQSID